MTTSMMARFREMSRKMVADFYPAMSPARTGSGGGVTEIADFGSNPGELAMRLYLPPRGARPFAPLLVLLHGCGQDADSFARAAGFMALADRLGCALVLPTQLDGNNRQRCFNWFQPDDVRRGQGEAASIHQMVLTALDATRADPDRIFIAGLSAGGAMAAAMLAAYPDVFAGGAVVAGLPVGVAHDVPSALTAMSTGGPKLTAEGYAALARDNGARDNDSWPTVSIWHGERDATVRPVNAEHLCAQWTALHGVTTARPDRFERVPGVTRRVWKSGRRPVVEAWLIDGMAHGLPTADAATEDKYVLPAGISACEEIARFWRLLS